MLNKEAVEKILSWLLEVEIEISTDTQLNEFYDGMAEDENKKTLITFKKKEQ